MAYIRQYKPSDEEAMIHIFRETATPHLRAHPDPLVLHYGSFIWCRPYIQLSPEYCFVLDDGTGMAVGYILCAPDTPAFIDRIQHEFIPMLETTYNIPQPGPKLAAAPSSSDGTSVVTPDPTLAARFLHSVHHPEDAVKDSPPTLLAQYPAHLHIDILPSHQSQGWGPQLITKLIDTLKAEHVPGIYLGMDAGNEGAGRFYNRIGFQRWPEVLDGGKSGRTGEDEHGVLFVQKISAD